MVVRAPMSMPRPEEFMNFTRARSTTTLVFPLSIRSCNFSFRLTVSGPPITFPLNSITTQLYFSEIVKLIRSEEHTSELQSRGHLVCRLLLEKKKIYQV